MTGGYIQTEKDFKDYGICMAYEDSDIIILPDSYETSFQPPYEKQFCGNCVAQTLANIMEVIYFNKMKRHEDFSVGFIYGNRSLNEYQGEGMTGYMACDHLVTDGDIKSAFFDNPGSAPSIITKVKEFKEANPNWKSNSYVPFCYIRTKDFEKVKKFIYKYDIPVMGISEVNKFYYGDGYHAMAIYGWKNTDTAIMQNSWGENSLQKIVEIKAKDMEDFWIIMPYQLANFKDLSSNHWAYDSIMVCAEDKILLGYPDNNFKPENNMTRAEFAAMVYRYLHK